MALATKLTAAKIALFAGAFIFSGWFASLSILGWLALLPLTPELVPDRGRLIKGIGINLLGAIGVEFLTGFTKDILAMVSCGNIVICAAFIAMIVYICLYYRMSRDILRKVLR